MLGTHFANQEKLLLAEAETVRIAGHSLHKGTMRELFLEKFLTDHLPSTLAIGTGEIIDHNSKPGEQRNQMDIVLYSKKFPKINFKGKINVFLIESVQATIEIKSKLNCEELEKAILAAHNTKKLTPSKSTIASIGYQPPKLLNYLVAYDGPKKMKTVRNWINKIYRKHGIKENHLSQDIKERIQTPSESLDGIFILGKGSAIFNNTPTGWDIDFKGQKLRTNWSYFDDDELNLLVFFTLLTQGTQNWKSSTLMARPYFPDRSILIRHERFPFGHFDNLDNPENLIDEPEENFSYTGNINSPINYMQKMGSNRFSYPSSDPAQSQS